MNSDVDFAVAAWHEGGTWNLEMLSDPYNLGSVIKELQNQQNNGVECHQNRRCALR